MGNEIRQGRPGEGEAIFRVVEAAFGLEAGTAKWEHRKREAESDAQRFRVLELDGGIVSVAHIREDRVQIGSSVVTKGDVGEVSTLPAFERRGLATKLMIDLIEWMRGHGHHLSRLGGYCEFYQRFGYVPFPRGLIQFPLAGLSSRGGFTDPEELLSESIGGGVVRPYHAVEDHEARARLYELFNRDRTGVVPRTFGDPPSTHEENPWHIAYERDGEVLGYMMASAAAEEHTLFEGKVQIHETAIDPACPEAMAALLRHVLLAAHRHGATRVTARLPLDYSLYQWYRVGSLGFVPMLYQSTESSNMLQVLDLTRLLQDIAPELQQRLRQSTLAEWSGRLGLRVADDATTIEVQDGQVEVADEATPDAIVLSQVDFLHLLLGLQSVEALALRSVSSPQKAALAALFPVEPTATGVWG